MFTTRQLVFIAIMAALLLAMNFVIGAGVIAMTGIPGSSALVDGVTNLAVITVVALTVRRFGVIGALYLVYGVLAIPTHMAGGPPGFIWKAPLLALGGFLFDTVLYLTNYEKKGFFIALPVMTVVGFALYLPVYYYLGMPAFQKLWDAFPYLAGSFILLGYAGIYVGYAVYDRLKDRTVLQQLQS